MESKELKDLICKELDDRKAVDITVLSVTKLTVIADYFIICTGLSCRQVKALAENVKEKLDGMDINCLRMDGIEGGKWVVMDYGGVIVHIFNDDTRMFYCLEKLWTDGDNVEFYKGK